MITCVFFSQKQKGTSNNTKIPLRSLRIGFVRDGLIGEDFALLIYDADLDGLDVVVNTDEKWYTAHFW